MEYTFRYGNSDIYGSIKEEISEAEEQLIIKAIKDSFDKLEDTYDLKPVRQRIFRDIAKIEPVTEDDILWIYFPNKLVEKVLFGK
ncbi:MAG: hypothetical protein J6Y48_11680 [Clostridia bacterium]|nr:hypothetical protein [Oscillospiraceae bacterium]MBP5727722.1 hypothetical protein [Clostridia bacterium]